MYIRIAMDMTTLKSQILSQIQIRVVAAAPVTRAILAIVETPVIAATRAIQVTKAMAALRLLLQLTRHRVGNFSD